MKNDSDNKYATPVANLDEFIGEAVNATNRERLKNGPTMKLRFPCDVHQTDNRTVEIPVLPVDYRMFDDSFEKMVHEQLGQTPGDEFIETMVQLISRKLVIAQIR